MKPFEYSFSQPQEELPIPTISINNVKADESYQVEKIYEALSSVGFFYLTDIPNFHVDDLLWLSHQFFDIEVNAKMQIATKTFNSENSNLYRGYVPPVPEFSHTHKEMFEIGAFNHPSLIGTFQSDSGRPYLSNLLHEPNVWPDFGSIEINSKFKKMMIKYYNIFRTMGDSLCRLVGAKWGVEDFFEESFYPFESSPILSTLRLLHYPTREGAYPADLTPECFTSDKQLISTPAHVDTSMFTLLSTLDNDGLQILTSEDEWIDVPPLKDALIVNIGKLLAELSDGRLKAASHRVLEIKKSRYSVAFFHEPMYGADVSQNFFGKEIAREPGQSIYGPWMMNTTKKYAEYAKRDFGLY